MLRMEGFVFSNGLPAFVSGWMNGGSLSKYRESHSKLDAESMVRQQNWSETVVSLKSSHLVGNKDCDMTAVPSFERNYSR